MAVLDTSVEIKLRYVRLVFLLAYFIGRERAGRIGLRLARVRIGNGPWQRLPS